jgi:hypothetical protein
MSKKPNRGDDTVTHNVVCVLMVVFAWHQNLVHLLMDENLGGAASARYI